VGDWGGQLAVPESMSLLLGVGLGQQSRRRCTVILMTFQLQRTIFSLAAGRCKWTVPLSEAAGLSQPLGVGSSD